MKSHSELSKILSKLYPKVEWTTGGMHPSWPEFLINTSLWQEDPEQPHLKKLNLGAKPNHLLQAHPLDVSCLFLWKVWRGRKTQKLQEASLLPKHMNRSVESPSNSTSNTELKSYKCFELKIGVKVFP